MSYRADQGRGRGRPAGAPTADVHVRLPLPMLAQLDTLRGDVPRLIFIRRILAEWLQAHDIGTQETEQ